MSAAAPTLAQIHAQADAIRRKEPKAEVIGIHASGRWSGNREQRVADRTYLIYQCDSPLATRIALNEPMPSGSTKVIVTGLQESDLGDDIRCRIERGRLYPINSWAIVQSLFQARHVDPRLSEHTWIADMLLESVPPGGYPPSKSGFLDAETAWPLLLDATINLHHGSPDLTAILKWSLDHEGTTRFREARSEFQVAAASWLSERAGPAVPAILKCITTREGSDALALGVVLQVLLHPDAAKQLQKALAKLEERYLSGEEPAADLLARWSASALEVVSLQLHENKKAKQEVLSRADAILKELDADRFAHLSDTSPTGFERRQAIFGAALVEGTNSPSTLTVDALVASRESLRRHDRAVEEPRSLELVDMAIRLTRWMLHSATQKRPKPQSLSESAAEHICEGAFVDWSRNRLRAGASVRELSEAYSRLCDKVAKHREIQAATFGQLLKDWTAAGSRGEDPVPIENFLSKVVAPLAHKAPILLIVIDGMSAAVFRELLSDLGRYDWALLSESRRESLRTAMATIPSVTEYSRTSLFCGALRRGTSVDEVTGFAEHSELVAASRGFLPPVLFHKPGLQDSQDAVLATEVRDKIASGQHRVVGIVINAVDDYLHKGEQIATRWTRDEIKVLPPLLHEAKAAKRIVILVSDHGHVLESKSLLRASEEGERWRRDDGKPLSDELQVRGHRVLAPDNRLIAPVTEKVRYSVKKTGYHGGLTPQEMVIPIGVLLNGQDPPSGWHEAGVQSPMWWDDPLPAIEAELKKDDHHTQRRLFEVTEPTVSALKVPKWVSKLLKNSIFIEQMELAKRAAPPADMTRKILTALDSRGGKLTRTALARSAEVPPLRMPGFMAALRRVLNVDGFDVLSVDEASDTVNLNRELLLKQFGITDGGADGD